MSIHEALDVAVEHHGAGRLARAGKIYERILRDEPDNPVALNLSGLIAHQGGDNKKALHLIARAVAIRPDYAEAHGNLGLALAAAGKPEDAVGSHRKALGLQPNSADAHCNLANALRQCGRLEEAVASYHEALSIEPNSPDLLRNLAISQQELGQTEAAAATYRSAISQAPQFVEAHCDLAKLLLRTGKHGEAAQCYQQALALHPGNAEAMAGLRQAYLAIGNAAADPDANLAALRADPGLPVANLILSRSLARMAPRWHVPMMNDELRNAAYYEALGAAVSPGDHVLDIGTGSGLLAMMAARAGAAKVTTCEAVPLIAATARAIIADNGLESVIDVVPKRSTDLKPGDDMERPADILVSEVLSSEFISEGVLATVEDARARLLQPDARIIPAGGEMMIALFGGEAIAKNVRVGEVSGFDLSRFNTIAPRKIALHRNDLEIELLCEPAAAFSFDFLANKRHPPARRQIELPVTSGGTCLGVIQWNRLTLHEDILFENHPSVKAAASAWNHALFAFDEPVELAPGRTVVLGAVHDRKIPWFSLLQVFQ